MPFNQKLQKFNAKINTVTIGSGDKTVTIGGDSTYPFYSFDAPSENTHRYCLRSISDNPSLAEELSTSSK